MPHAHIARWQINAVRLFRKDNQRWHRRSVSLYTFDSRFFSRPILTDGLEPFPLYARVCIYIHIYKIIIPILAIALTTNSQKLPEGFFTCIELLLHHFLFLQNSKRTTNEKFTRHRACSLLECYSFFTFFSSLFVWIMLTVFHGAGIVIYFDYRMPLFIVHSFISFSSL